VVINGNHIPAGATATLVYRVSVITTRSNGEEDTLSASARVSLRVNLPPSSGSCEVGPAEGFALETDFSISCHGWKDESNSALRYEFIATTDSGQRITLRPITGSNKLRAFNMPSPKVRTIVPLATSLIPLFLSQLCCCCSSAAVPLPQFYNDSFVPCKQEGQARYTAGIEVLISDKAGGTVKWSGATITVQDPFEGNKTNGDIAAALAKFVDGKIVASLQKGDRSMALATIANVASAATGYGLGPSLLAHLQAAATGMVIRPENVVEVIQALYSVTTHVKEELNTTHIQQLVELARTCASRVSASAMSLHTAGLFVQALGAMLDPPFFERLLEEDFENVFSEVGNETDDRRLMEEAAATNFTTTLSRHFEDIKVAVGSALLKMQVEGEASVQISAGGVSLSVQKQYAHNVGKGQTLREFSGAELRLPGDILRTIGEEATEEGGSSSSGSVSIFVGYTTLVWPGNVNVVAIRKGKATPIRPPERLARVRARAPATM
jgi:hypothetical protein